MPRILSIADRRPSQGLDERMELIRVCRCPRQLPPSRKTAAALKVVSATGTS
jgi:hypothetical protein